MRETDKWPLGYLAREATRNVMAWGARLFPVLLIGILLGSGIVALAVKETKDYEARVAQLAAQGRNVVSLYLQGDSDQEAANPDDGLGRRSCEALNDMRGVVAAGLVGEGLESQNIAQLSSLTQVRPVSATLLPQLTEYDLVIGAAAAENAGLAPDAQKTILTSKGTLLTGIVNTEIGPRVPSTLAVFSVLGPEIQHEKFCNVILDQKADVAGMIPILEASLTAKGGDVVSQVIFVEQFDVRKDFLNRTERFAAPAAGIFGGLILAILTFMRSSELAAYRLSGTSPRSLGLMLSFESALIAGTFFTSAAVGVAVFYADLFSSLATLLWAATGAGTWMFVSWLLALPVLRRKPSDMAKDR